MTPAASAVYAPRWAGAGAGQASPRWPTRSRFLGGVATWRELRVVHPARLIRRAVDAGVVVRAHQGPLRPAVHCRAARAWRSRAVPPCRTSARPCTTGGRSRRSRMPPGSPFARNRRLRLDSASAIRPRRADLAPATCVTVSPRPCARSSTAPGCFPFDEALAVADSALRSRNVDAGRAAAKPPHGPPGPVRERCVGSPIMRLLGRPTRSSRCSVPSPSRRASSYPAAAGRRLRALRRRRPR